MPSYNHVALATPDTAAPAQGSGEALRALSPGLDSGSWMLARAGVLNGYRATSHWDILNSLSEEFPEVDVVADRFVIDRNRASCGGARRRSTSCWSSSHDDTGRRWR